MKIVISVFLSCLTIFGSHASRADTLISDSSTVPVSILKPNGQYTDQDVDKAVKFLALTYKLSAPENSGKSGCFVKSEVVGDAPSFYAGPGIIKTLWVKLTSNCVAGVVAWYEVVHFRTWDSGEHKFRVEGLPRPGPGVSGGN